MPDTPVPPTTPVPLSALLARTDLGLRQIAGPPEADVHWVHTSEMADPYPYLLGGELLLTAGVQLTDPERYAARVAEAGAAALGFGVTPVYDTVPAALVDACERHGLPLLEVPPPTTFSAIARAVWGLMTQARHHELRRVSQAQQGLASAAARADPVPAVLHQLATRLGGWAGLLTPEGSVLQAAGRDPSTRASAALRHLAAVVAPGTPGSPASATDTSADAHLAAYPLAGPQGLVLGIVAEGREAGDHTIAGVASVLLSLLTAPRQGAGEAARSAALVRLLLGAAPGEVAPLLGEAPWTVVHARGEGAPPDLGSPLVDADDGHARVLVPGGHDIAPHPGWTLGVSAPVAADGLAAADAQAARALRRAEAARTTLVRHRTGGYASLVDPEEAAAYARQLLAPLTEPLLTTLRCWLSLHGSWDRTAVALGVHRNTVRQRLARCAALLDADLDDMDVRTELWLALRGADGSAESHSGQCE
ncbi:PucR family transcriptional regulator ligand-binding domain-containing protein [Streptomyces sp. BR1]|uniref:PucR family transcriptional regulator ligand-binding domain-containing protein n=1 Tax=Streptomyces sp. BR1 TaxID=1592323 RepID=UPI00402B7708